MKKLFALFLAAAMLLSLSACDKGGNSSGGKENLETFEMEVLPSGVEEPAKVTIGYPKSFTKEVKDWCVVLTDEAKDVEVEAYFINDYNCYDINQEYAEEEYYFYEEATFGDYRGYACMTDEASADMEVYIYLDCVAEIDDVYLCFFVSSASLSLDADVKALYKLDVVQQILNSVEYTAPAEPA